MRKTLIVVLSVVSITFLGATSSAKSQSDGISPSNTITLKGSEANISPRAVPAVVAAGAAAARVGTAAARAGRAAYNAWKAVPAPEKSLMTQAARNAIGFGGKDNEKKYSEYVFD